MRLSHDIPCRLARFCFALTMIAAWSGMPQCSSADQAGAGNSDKTTPPTESPAQAKDRAERCFRVLQAIERGVPRDTFDISAVAAAVGKDPGANLKWVQDHAAWVPYRGMLRGPVGVLMDRRGNSLDRATLLAELLRASGSSVRLAHGTLSEDAALRLSKTLHFAPRMPLPSPAALDPGFVDNLVKDYAGPYGLDPARLRREAEDLLTRSQRATEDIADRTVRQTSTLSALIGAAAEPQGNRAQATVGLAPAVVEALKDHWWVQVGAGDKWTDLDPDFSASGADSPLPKSPQVIDWQPKDGHWPLDPTLCHEIELRVVVEKWDDGRLSEQTALRQSLRPSELIGQFISVSLTPMNWPADLDLSREADPAAKIKSLALEQHEWLPVLRVGQQFYHQGSITDTGAVNANPDLGAMKKAGKGVAGAGDAVTRLFGGDTPAPPPQRGVLTAAWLEYEIRSPEAPPRQIRRQVFDLLGPAARGGARAIPQPTLDADTRLSRGLSLLGQTEVLPLVCQLSDAFVEDLTARNALAMRDVVIRLDGAETNAAVTEAAGALQTLAPLPSRLYDLALARHRLNPRRGDVYLNRPNILSLHQFLRNDTQNRLVFCIGTDIAANEVAVRPDLSSQASRQAQLTQGVLDTCAEALLSDQGARVPNPSDLLAAKPAAENWLVVRYRNDPAWQNAQVPKDTRARIDSELAHGFIIVIDPHVGPGSQQGWWRIDPRTGQTLGVNDRGWGADIVEEAFLMATFAGGCLAMYGQSDKAGNISSDRKAAVICLLASFGVLAGAPAALTLKVFIGAACAGGAVGYGAGL